MPRSMVKNPNQKFNDRMDNLIGTIAGEQKRFHKTDQDMANKSHMHIKTYQDKIKNRPEDFTVKELYELLDNINVRLILVRAPQPQ